MLFENFFTLIQLLPAGFSLGEDPSAITRTNNRTITFNDELLKAFDLNTGERFVVIKSITIAMSYNPIDTFKEKLRKHGFFEAVNNIDKLEIF